MSIINRDLVKDINSGKCLVLIGSGPSIELGLPSWYALANSVVNSLNKDEYKREIQKCKYLLKDRNYPAIFSIGEKLLGSEFLKNLIKESYACDRTDGTSYSYLTNWPFHIYLTTNYDDCIYNHLRSNQVVPIKKGNTQTDFTSLNAYEKDIVFKIHGDADNYDSIVLTQEQYDEFLSSSKRTYWREKICSVLHMLPVLIVGYSISDPDFKSQLERAKKIALENKVYLITADMPPEDASKLNLDYGIKIITYKNINGDHSELLRLLNRYNRFVAKRKSINIGREETSFDEVETASSLYIFIKLVSTEAITSSLLRSYMGLIIDELFSSYPESLVSRFDLLNCINKRLFTNTIDIEVFEAAIDKLYELGLIGVTEETVQILAPGKDIHSRSYASSHNVESKFDLLCGDYLKQRCQEISDKQVEEVIARLKKGLIVCFKRRGIEIVTSISGKTDIDFSTSTDMIEVINQYFDDIDEYELRSASADLLIDVILNPTNEVKDYLVMISHGFFAYHALGLEKTSLMCRKQIAKDTEWIVDSSILIPLIALHCDSQEYAADLINRMKSCGLALYATEKILHEVVSHAIWMINRYLNCNYDNGELLSAILDSPGHKRNLFIDGYVNWSVGKASPSVKKYIEYCFPSEYGKKYEDRVRNILLDKYVNILDIADRFDLNADYLSDICIRAEQIKQKRMERGTVRGSDGGDHQSQTEAEIMALCMKHSMYFLTNSTFLNSSSEDQERFAWNPDTMYKYLTMISTELPDSDLLFQSMMQEFYYAGFDVMNQEAVHEYFKDPVKQARFAIEEVKKEFSNELKNGNLRRMVNRFEGLDDFQKPFYARRITEYIVRKRSEDLQAKANAAEAKISEAALSIKERKEYEILKQKDIQKKTGSKNKRKHQKKKRKPKGKKKK